MAVHPSAIVDSSARIDPSAEIGPYCLIGAEVEIGARTRLLGHVFLDGPTWIGEDNLLYPFSSVGAASQDLKYKGERAETRIGSRNQIREGVTIHRGTEGGGALTSIGNDNLLMAYAHVAHDCKLGDFTVLANAATLGGHVTVEDYARIGAFSGVHQYCRIGRHAMVGGYSVITRDVLPFALVSEEREARMFRANSVGLERRGFPPETAQLLNKAFRLLREKDRNTTQAVERIRAEIQGCAEVDELLRFLETSERGVIK